MDQVKNFHIFIEGRVQGVGYRKFAQKAGAALGLKGWVRNRLDGRVEIQVSGSAPKLNQFVAELGVGPAFAKVKNVTTNLINEELTQDFTIEKDQELK